MSYLKFKTMKFKSLFLMALVAMAFTACSKDDDLQGGGEDQGIEEKGEAYASLSFAMPGGAMTKASGDDKPDTDPGSKDENTIVDVLVIGFEKVGGKHSFTQKIERKDLTSTGEGINLIFRTMKPFSIPAGDQLIYVVVNASEKIKGKISEAIETQIEKTKKDAFDRIVFDEDTQTSLNNAAFLMTSADGAQLIKADTTVNTSANPVAIKINVERAVGKISFASTVADNTYIPEKKYEKFDNSKVKLIDYRLIGTRNSEYLLRRTGLNNTNSAVDGIGGSQIQIPENYVIEPVFDDKKLENANHDWIKTKYSLYPATVKDNQMQNGFGGYLPLSATLEATAPQTLGYCLENTMPSTASLKGFGTGVIFKAAYDLDGDGTPKTFYRYLGVLYASFADLINVATHVVDADDTDVNSVSVLKQKGVDKFVGGICYYPYWISHIKTTKDEAQIMEFAIVRNNVYKLSVSKIKHLGEVAEMIDPTDPIKDGSAKLDVTISILPWVVRDNGNIEL
ncbi:MAG: Mfa1 family fimbria major subunit [Bacteroidales bacterium]